MVTLAACSVALMALYRVAILVYFVILTREDDEGRECHVEMRLLSPTLIYRNGPKQEPSCRR
jgi:hypothetical protein